MRRHVTIAIAVALALASMGSPTHAEEEASVWSSPLALGPSDATSLAARPGLVLAGGKVHEKDAFGGGAEAVGGPRVAGIFRSTDLGRTWERGRERIVHPNGDQELRTIEETPNLVALPQTPPDAYSILGNKVWRSEDDGSTWRRVGDLGATPSTFDVLADGRLLAGLSTGGLRVSADRGATWATMGTGLPSARVNEVHPHSATVMLVATDLGLYRSADGGSTFTQATTGLAQPSSAALGVAGFNSSQLYLAMPGNTLTSTAIYTSTDGTAWQPRVPLFGQNLLPRVNPGALEVVVHNSLYMLFAGTSGGLYRSGSRTTPGVEWDRVDPEPGTSGVRELAAVDTDPGSLTKHALLAALDRASPAVITEGAANQPESRLAAPGWIDEAEGGRICGGLVVRKDGVVFAACGRHIFRSDDRGANWTGAGRGLPYITAGIGDTPYNPLALGADGSLWTSGFHYGLYHSNATVTQWTKVPIPAASVGAIGTHPTNANIVYAAGLLTNGATGVLWRTTDGGTSWIPSPELGTAIYNIEVNPATPTKVLVAGYSRGVYYSEDSGATWITATGVSGNVYRVRYVPGSPNRAFALTSDGLFRSEDAGKSFMYIGEIFIGGRESTTFEMEVSPWDASTIYVLPTDGDLAVSRDGGESWAKIDQGLPKDADCSICEDIGPLTLDASAPGRMYIAAGVMGHGAEPHSYWIYRGTDEGA